MIRPLVVALVLALCATGAWADPYSRGVAYAEKGEVDRAIADYTKAIAINPKLADAYNNRGVSYRKKGDKEHAIADFRKALEIDPSGQLAKIYLKSLGVTP